MGNNSFSLKAIIDLEQIKRLAERFCLATNVFAYAVDREGKPIIRLSGNNSDRDKIWEYMDKGQAEELVERVKAGSLEEQVVEQTDYVNMMAAAISIQIKGEQLLTWIVYGVLEDKKAEPGKPYIMDVKTRVTERIFYAALDLLRDSSCAIFENKLSLANAQAENVRSRNSENEMEQFSKRIEATTNVVQLLDCEETMEKNVAEIMGIAGKHLDVSSAQLYKINRKENTMDVISEWCREGVVSFFDKTKKLQIFSFLNQDKPLVISSDSFENTEAGRVLAEFEVKAMTAFPVQIQDADDMYLCLMDDKERMWQVEEIKFMRDVAKLLQSVLQKQVWKDAIASSFAATETILDNMNSGIYVREAETKKQLFVNRNMKEIFATELLKGTLDELLEQGITKGCETDNRELYYRELDQWYDLLYMETVWVDGKAAEMFCLYDITDRKIYQRKIEQQAYTDFLTGLYNRMCCERDLARHIDNAKKNHTTGALLYLDLDDFKHINDGLGHQYGDILLRAISTNLRDIVGIENSCYRMGGDEFVIIIPPENYSQLKRIVEEIQEIFNKPWFLKDADYYCTMSMGIVNYPDNSENVQDLIVKADVAMFEAKKAGKNRVTNYSEELTLGSNKRLDMEKNMRDATANGYHEFEVYFQPVIDIQRPGNPCTGAEALIRWNSSEMGVIAPSEFIPLAEYLGLINPIGNYVLKTACKACKSWNDNGHPEYKVNVNLSVIQLLQPDIVEIVAQTIAETGINPRNLTLEVTESLAINDMSRMKEILGNIKKLGVRIALDDFGTGYSSLNHIREIPFDVIKVDQSFVKDLADDTYSQSFIKMVSELASTIGVSICVEGIETKAQYKVLEGMKVRLIQGYYFGRPMPRQVFEEKYCS
ncbi:MAG: EAL domain-containing protein [Lachnospiraceae bacterium]|nr:EAL domain-containing protein [Lachnospiraceae bacterium]